MADQYVDKVPELRKKFLDSHNESNTNYYDVRDITRVKCDDKFVSQFLNGTNGDVGKAHKIMIDGLKYRNSYGINDLSEKDIHEDVLKSGALYMHGKDKKGAAMLLVEMAKYSWKGDKEKSLAYKKLLVYNIEKHQLEHPDQKLTMVSECAGAGLANMDSDNIKFFGELMTIVYPDILAVWQIAKVGLGSKLTSKYIFPREDDVWQYIDKDQLPASFGGESEFVYKYLPEEKTDPDDNS